LIFKHQPGRANVMNKITLGRPITALINGQKERGAVMKDEVAGRPSVSTNLLLDVQRKFGGGLQGSLPSSLQLWYNSTVAVIRWLGDCGPDVVREALKAFQPSPADIFNLKKAFLKVNINWVLEESENQGTGYRLGGKNIADLWSALERTGIDISSKGNIWEGETTRPGPTSFNANSLRPLKVKRMSRKKINEYLDSAASKAETLDHFLDLAILSIIRNQNPITGILENLENLDTDDNPDYWHMLCRDSLIQRGGYVAICVQKRNRLIRLSSYQGTPDEISDIFYYLYV